MDYKELYNDEHLRSQEEKLRIMRESHGSSTEILDLSYKTWINRILRRTDIVINPKERERLMSWYDEGMHERLPPLPDALRWMEETNHEKSWIQLLKCLRVCTVAAIRYEALHPESKHPRAVHRLFEQIDQQMESFRGRPIRADRAATALEAMKLRQAGLKGLPLALRVCPDRVDPNHQCSTVCVNRIRVTIRDFKRKQRQESPAKVLEDHSAAKNNP
jgi:hypothetical protein